MRKFVHATISALVLTSALFSNLLIARPAEAQAQTSHCQEGTQPGGAHYQICLPSGAWNGDLVAYAHGYVPVGSRLSLPSEARQIASSVMPLGFAFATTSYRTNGLAVLPAQEDLLDLMHIFRAAPGNPKRVFLVGASEGGLITTLSIEQHPEIYSGGLEMCGPVGNFQDQINYFGDFRVVFDALFPDLIPPSPTHIPTDVAERWYSQYQNRILPTITNPANRDKIRQLLAVTGAPFDTDHPETMETTIRGALGYNIFATNDASVFLGGNPYDNQSRVYTGSADDQALNRSVERIQADQQAVRALTAYRTSGNLQVPLVAIHTTGDEIVPFFHMDRYQQKVQAAGRGALLQMITIRRYGHCNFTQAEIQDAFSRLVEMVQTQPTPAPTLSEPMLPSAQEASNTPMSPVDTSSTPAVAPHSQSIQSQEPLARAWAWLVQTIRGLVQ